MPYVFSRPGFSAAPFNPKTAGSLDRALGRRMGGGGEVGWWESKKFIIDMQHQIRYHVMTIGAVNMVIRSQLQDQLEEVTRRIVQAFDPQRIIVFGSHAYGQPTLDSDVDLLIVMESNERPAMRAMRISKLLRPRPFPMDILVRTPEEIRQRLEMGDYFIQEIITQGRVLYERPLRTGMDIVIKPKKTTRLLTF